MKICYLADAVSIHTKKWAEYFVEKGHSVHILSFRKADIKNVHVHHIDVGEIYYGGTTILKLKYLKTLFQVKRLLKELKPDILHAHNASSYGLLGALSFYHPFVLSVWGSDVFNFPTRSFLHKKILQFNLKKADHICSTSKMMAVETNKYTKKEIIITPFGVDCDKFKPVNSKDFDQTIIGTIKMLEEIYGIEDLIKAFAIASKKYPNQNLKLLIVGEGSLRNKMESLSKDLDILNISEFAGKIAHSQVPDYLNRLSIYVAVSIHESFGVSVIEASACGVPVVISNVGGLPEVVQDGVTGFIVPSKDPEATANAIEKLLLDETLRERMGRAGRNFVLENYDWSKNAKIMDKLYEDILIESESMNLISQSLKQRN